MKLVAERGLLKGERLGVDGSTMEANAALRSIVRRDSRETYQEKLTHMATESGITRIHQMTDRQIWRATFWPTLAPSKTAARLWQG